MTEVSNTTYTIAVQVSSAADSVRATLRKLIQDAQTALTLLDKGTVWAPDLQALVTKDTERRECLATCAKIVDAGGTELRTADYLALISGTSWREVLKAVESRAETGK